MRISTTLLLAAALAASRPSLSCSICRCGDATFNALGRDIYGSGAFRLAVDWDHVDKSQGSPEVGESMLENRVTATAFYSFADRVNLLVRIPYSFRTVTSTGDGHTTSVSTSGLSDPEFSAWVRIWGSDLAPGIGRRTSLSLFGGGKTSWGRNDVTGPDGERADEHSQPGTGSTDVFAGAAFLWMFDPSSTGFASVQYRWTGTNSYGYRYGRSFLANVACDRRLTPALDAVLELNFRNAGMDRTSDAGDLDPDTGGSLLYVTPRVLVSLGGGVVARVAVQIPVVRSLNGVQTERVVANAGFTFLF